MKQHLFQFFHTVHLYHSFLIFPFILSILWVLLPIDQSIFTSNPNEELVGNYLVLSVQYIIYYMWANYIWMVFYDFALPGAPLWLIVGEFIVCGAALCVSLILIWMYPSSRMNKLTYASLGWIESSIGFLCYIIYGLYLSLKEITQKSKTVKKSIEDTDGCHGDKSINNADSTNQIQSYGSMNPDDAYQDVIKMNHMPSTDTYVISDDYFSVERSNEKASKLENEYDQDGYDNEGNQKMYCSSVHCWSEKIVNISCFSSIFSEEQLSLIIPSEKSRHCCWIKKIPENQYPYYSSMNEERRTVLVEVDTDLRNSVVSPTQRKLSVVFKGILSLIIFKVMMVLVWFFLMSFQQMWQHYTEYRFLLTILFQTSKILSALWLEIGSDLFVPARDVPQLKYIHKLVIQMFYSLFYRNLFVEVKSWGTVVQMALVTFTFQFIMHPLRLTKPVYKIFKKVKIWSMYVTGIKWINKDLFHRVKNYNYREHVRGVAASYYLRQVGEYYTLFSFVLYLWIIPYSWNYRFYPTFSEMESTHHLMFQMLVLFGIELSCDILMRNLMYCISGMDMIMIGKAVTIHGTKTRYIMSIFMLHFLHDIYYSIQRMPDRFTIW